MAELTDKQQRFVAEYLVDHNATQAAIRAGYTANTAESQGSRLLRNAKVLAALEEARAAQGKRLQITADRVLEEIARVAFSDIRDVARWGTTPAGRAFFELYASEDLTDEAAAAVSQVTIKRKFIPGPNPDSEPFEIEETGIKMADKMKALDMLAKRLGLFAPDKVDVTITADPAEVRGRLLDRLTRLAPKPGVADGK